MNNKAFDRLTTQLIDDIENHSHRQELVDLMLEQVIDDSTQFEPIQQLGITPIHLHKRNIPH